MSAIRWWVVLAARSVPGSPACGVLRPSRAGRTGRSDRPRDRTAAAAPALTPTRAPRGRRPPACRRDCPTPPSRHAGRPRPRACPARRVRSQGNVPHLEVPPAGLEPTHPAPEAGALSAELRRQDVLRRLTSAAVGG